MDVVKKAQGKNRWSESFTSCDEQYEYVFRVNMVNESYEPSYQLPENWEYRFEAPKVGNGFEVDFRFEIAEVYEGSKYEGSKYEGSKYEDTCITGIVIDFDGKYAH